MGYGLIYRSEYKANMRQKSDLPFRSEFSPSKIQRPMVTEKKFRKIMGYQDLCLWSQSSAARI